MFFPYIQERQTYQSSISEFRGYNHTNLCADGQFYNMKNMSSDEYPYIGTRKQRKKLRTFTNLQGILSTNDHIVWIDDGKLFVDAEEKTFAEGITLSAIGEKTIAKLNTQIIIYPDKVWYDINKDESGKIEEIYNHTTQDTITDSTKTKNMTYITYAKDEGAVRYVNERSYSSTIGVRMGSISDDNTFYLQEKTDTGVWKNVAKPQHRYIEIYSPGLAKGFKDGDFVKITLSSKDNYLSDLFVNQNDDGSVYFWTKIIKRRYDEDDNEGYITFEGDLPKSYVITNNNITVERTSPDMAYIVESTNRLWGCSADGHHIYASKLGDATVWNSFEGISTDAWETAVGSDGEFTGAIAYDGMPMFFKEDRIVKLTISAIGAHQTKEVVCRGVQKGSSKSLVNTSVGLIYKSHDCICGYNGAMPIDISDALGSEIFTEACAGVLYDKYYVSMKKNNGDWCLYVYDTKNAIWSKYDDVHTTFFCAYNNDLLIGANNVLYSTEGTETSLSVEGVSETESSLDWHIESAQIGFYSAEHKYVKKINLRALIGKDTTATLYIQYEGGEWEKQYDIKGNGICLSTFSIIPHRCDHFKWKVEGIGTIKIYNVFTTVELGSDRV